MRTASENFRGRVMGVRMMVIYGLPIGLLAAGSLIDEIGFAATGTLYAAAGLALDAGGRAALARRPLARARAGECALGG